MLGIVPSVNFKQFIRQFFSKSKRNIRSQILILGLFKLVRLARKKNESVAQKVYIIYSLLLEDFRWYEPRECLVVFPFSVCLPPVGILLVDYVQNVSLLEGDAELAAWNVDVFLRVVIKVCSYMDLGEQRIIIFDNTNFRKYFSEILDILLF